MRPTAQFRRRVSAIALAFIVPVVAGCSARDHGFSESRARAHVSVLASQIGSRPTGSEANRLAREYIIGQLRAYGFDVRVQEADAERPSFGVTAHVRNVIATRRGATADAIALVSHYDSVPDGPGAADDALGVAVCLEAGRVLAAGPRAAHTLLVIVTDGEEAGLMGAAAVLKDPAAKSIRAVLNFEAIGSSGPGTLFETGPDSGRLVSVWARESEEPAGASFMQEIYRVLPNDTDFTLFERARIPGLNFAAVGDSYSYHTPLDRADRLDPLALRQTGRNAVAIVRALDNRDLPGSTPAGTFFDVDSWTAVAYGRTMELVLLAMAVAAALTGWTRIAGVARDMVGLRHVLLTVLWTAVGIVAMAAAMVAASWLVRATRDVYHPWYARPEAFFIFLAFAGAIGGSLVVRAGRLLPAIVRGSTLPAVVWTLTLPAWLTLAIAAALVAPAASFLTVLPLACAGVLLAILPVRRPAVVRQLSVIVLAAAGLLWIRSGVMLLDFTVAVLGRLPIVTPIVVYPAMLGALGLFLVPPVLAIFGGRRALLPPEIRNTVSIFTFVALFGWAWFAPAYTPDRPLHRSVRYVSDAGVGESYFEVAGNEPALDVGPDAPVVGGWSARPSPVELSTPVDPLRGPFTFRARAAVQIDPPLRIFATRMTVDDGVDADVRVVPLVAPLTVALRLPQGARPAAAGAVGVISNNRYELRYVALPPDGVTWRLRFGAADAARLGSAVVIAVANGVPGGAWPRLPAWLPQERAVWAARSYFVVPVRFASTSARRDAAPSRISSLDRGPRGAPQPTGPRRSSPARALPGGPPRR